MGRELNTGSAPGALVVLGGVDEPWLASLEQAGWSCHRCYDLRAAESLLLDLGPCIGVVDLSQDDFSLQGIAALVNRNKQVRWLAMVREEQLGTVAICQFIVSFCIDYFTSPVPVSRLQETIGHQLGMLQLERKVWPQLGQLGQQGLQGTTDVMKKLRHHVKRMAMTNVPVFIQGEIGTGKELVARAIHQASTRAKYPFIRVNCEAISAAWQGEAVVTASDKDKGLCCFAAADQGVLYLNDISALTDARQQELLLFLQDGVFTAPDGQQIPTDVRLIVSTSYPVEALVTEGKLRQDLLYRLNVLSLAVPSLRERGPDILLLSELFLLKFARQYNSAAKQFSEDAQKMLLSYPWPGNVRELISQMKRAVLLAEQQCIEADHLDIPRSSDDKQSLKRIREESERSALLAVLENNKGQISAAARELGISRATMYRLLSKHDLDSAQRNFR
ncbi:VpsR-related response regulator [Photobacterium sagamiensis]|uniref:sigma-54-dependent transcriptional regulator n=1 Tax=Photobacterium sagamiensis TaxID=2910241 RepID=UPI003D09890F